MSAIKNDKYNWPYKAKKDENEEGKEEKEEKSVVKKTVRFPSLPNGLSSNRPH